MTEAATTGAPAETKPAKAPKIEQNGVTRPSAESATGKVWAVADSLSQAAGKPAGRAEVLKAAEAAGLNTTTAATQYGRWCKFNGVVKAPAEKKEAPAAAATVATTGEAGQATVV